MPRTSFSASNNLTGPIDFRKVGTKHFHKAAKLDTRRENDASYVFFRLESTLQEINRVHTGPIDFHKAGREGRDERFSQAGSPIESCAEPLSSLLNFAPAIMVSYA